ncbi:MAG TPA: rhomboid family intramembrane serine protease [Lacipirellulaceae bacterium]|nr:rhomboid family intramembrane serine protease [Lacipirellulaceae bacterium]
MAADANPSSSIGGVLGAVLAYNGSAMGFYDRDYQRGGYYNHQPGLHLGGPRTLTTDVVIFTCVVYLVQLICFYNFNNWLADAWVLPKGWFHQPWQAYRLLTYGFLHSPRDIWHIAINMFVLWLFGREVEFRYGRREFLIFYLVAIVVAGIVWSIAETANPMPSKVLGASGGISAVVILFAMNFPYRTILFMFFIPMPMWLCAVLMVLWDAYGAIQRSGTIACTAHLGGAMFGFLYFQMGWRLERFLPSSSFWDRLKPKPKLHVHDPDTEDETEKAVDDILKKIQEHGRDSLTRRERRILEEASREYQKKRR